MPSDRPAAWALLTEFTLSQPLRRHALAVEATMRHLARTSGVGDAADVERWGIVGMLHDFDYERFPTEADHPQRGMEIMTERGWPAEIVRAIGGHAFHTGIDRRTPMEKAILAADELTGFVGACCHVREGGIATLEVKSVTKKLKDKGFAAKVERAEVLRGAELLGVELAAHAQFVIDALRPHAAELGLGPRA